MQNPRFFPTAEWLTGGYGAFLSVLGAVCLSAAVGAATAQGLLHFPFLSGQVLLAVAIGGVSIYPIIRRIMTRRFNPFEPIVGASAAFLLLFSIRPIAIITKDESLYHGYDLGPYIGQTLLVALVGTAAFVIAYELALNSGSPSNPRPLVTLRESLLSLESVYTYGIGLVVVASLLFLVHLSLGGSIVETFRLISAGRSDALHALSANSSEYLSAAPLLPVSAALLIIVATRNRSERLHLVLTLLAIAFPVVIFSFIGNRRFILPSLVIPLAAYYLSRMKQPSYFQLALAIPLAFVIIATIPYARAAGAREHAGGVLPIFQESFSSPADTIWTTLTESGDTGMFSTLAVEVAVLDSPSDFFYGTASFGDLVIAPIPSVLFPGKPESARDEMLIKAFGEPCRISSGGFCPDFTALGTFYQDFWYFGVFAGMAALGVVAGRSWRAYIAGGSEISIVTTACLVVFLPIMIRAGFMPGFVWMLYFLIPSWVGLRLALMKGEPGQIQSANHQTPEVKNA